MSGNGGRDFNHVANSILANRTAYPIASGLCTQCKKRDAAIQIGAEALCWECDSEGVNL